MSDKDQKTGGEGGKSDDDGIDWKAEAAKWKDLSRKHEARAKENADAAKKLEEAENATKTAEERAEARIAEIEKQLAETNTRAMRAEVASAKGLTPAQAKRLQGSTIEELMEDADDLLTSFKPADKDGGSDKDDKSGKDEDGKDTAKVSRRPSEKLRPGSANEADPDVELDPVKLAEKIPRG